MFKLSKTFAIITPESAADGDFADGGFEYRDAEFDTLFDLAREIRDDGAFEASSTVPHVGIWYSTDAIDTDYRTGEQTIYSFHPADLSEADTLELYRLMTLTHAEFNAERQHAERWQDFR